MPREPDFDQILTRICFHENALQTACVQDYLRASNLARKRGKKNWKMEGEMIDVQTLRGYPFFASLTEAEVQTIVPLVLEDRIPYNGVFFQEGQPAEYLFLLTRGSVDLYFKMPDDPRHRVLAGEIEGIEPFGISALIEPHTYAMTARAGTECRVLRVDGKALRDLMEKDSAMGYTLMREIAKASMERMHFAQQRLAEEQQPDLVI